MNKIGVLIVMRQTTDIFAEMKKVKDMRDNPLLLFVNPWSVGMTLDRNPDLKLSEFGKNNYRRRISSLRSSRRAGRKKQRSSHNGGKSGM